MGTCHSRPDVHGDRALLRSGPRATPHEATNTARCLPCYINSTPVSRPSRTSREVTTRQASAAPVSIARCFAWHEPPYPQGRHQRAMPSLVFCGLVFPPNAPRPRGLLSISLLFRGPLHERNPPVALLSKRHPPPIAGRPRPLALALAVLITEKHHILHNHRWPVGQES